MKRPEGRLAIRERLLFGDKWAMSLLPPSMPHQKPNDKCFEEVAKDCR
jgi:hypothetical protein